MPHPRELLLPPPHTHCPLQRLSRLIVLVVAVTAAVGRALNKTSGRQAGCRAGQGCAGGRRGGYNNAKSASNQINSNVTKNIHILSTFVGRRDAIAPPKWLGPPQSRFPSTSPSSSVSASAQHCAVQLRVFWADLRRVINFVDSAVAAAAAAAAACTGSDIIIIVIVIVIESFHMLIIALK